MNVSGNAFNNWDPRPNTGDRFFFFPFLTGALVGGAAVGLTRPRPIYNVAPAYPYPAPYPVPYGRPPYYGPSSYYYGGGYSAGPYGY